MAKITSKALCNVVSGDTVGDPSRTGPLCPNPVHILRNPISDIHHALVRYLRDGKVTLCSWGFAAYNSMYVMERDLGLVAKEDLNVYCRQLD